MEITKIAENLDVHPEHLKLYGKWKAKIDLGSVNQRVSNGKRKLILITAITPTSAGEGKTVTSIGLSMALNRLGHKAVVCLRQPSLGPVFGVKGGAAGGGKSTVEPMHDINLRFTGDIDAVGASHNLLSAMLDNHIYRENKTGIDIRTISWKRAIDMNERSLRQIVIGLGKSGGIPREDGFIITAASEVMAILCFANGYDDLKQRLAQIIVGYTPNYEKPIRALDLRAQGAMTAILKDAMEPNLAQTSEGTPALIHGGPFGNIAMGTCSLTSIHFALNHSDYAVVEAGFGSDLGAEKFFDVVSRVGGLNVDCAVIVASIRSLKNHESIAETTIGKTSRTGEIAGNRPMGGLENLGKHIENVRMFGVEPVVAINKFETDTQEEIQTLKDYCEARGVSYSVSEAFNEGSLGCLDVAKKVVEACERPNTQKYIYEFEESIEAKIEKIVNQIYGGDKTEYLPEALRDIRHINALGLESLPLCMAKTQLSLSDDPKKLGRPRGFAATVRRVGLAAGAGFIIVDMGDIVEMPGLPMHPAAEGIDMDQNGVITGVF